MEVMFSQIQENCNRVKAIYDLVYAEYIETRGKSARKRIIDNKDVEADDEQYTYLLHEESSLIGLLIVWSITTVEGLINHALAGNINNKILSILAIENPKKVLDGNKIVNVLSSELSYKLLILGENSNESQTVARELEKIISIRNSIIHDKPYIIDYANVESNNVFRFSNKKVNNEKKYYYEDLKELFGIFDIIFDYILKKTNINSSLKQLKFHFIDLLL